MKLLQYVPHNSFIVEGTHETMAELEKRHDVLWIGYLQPDDKMVVHGNGPSFVDEPRHDGFLFNASRSVQKPFELIVALTKTQPRRSNAELNVVANMIHDLLTAPPAGLDAPDLVHIDPIHSKNRRIVVEFASAEDRDKAPTIIAQIPIVVSVEPRQPIHLNNIWGRGILEAGRTTAPNLNDPNSLVIT